MYIEYQDRFPEDWKRRANILCWRTQFVNNKIISGEADAQYLGEEKEWLVQYCKRKLEGRHYDYFVFGHRHLPLEIDLNGKSTYVNLGDWIKYFTYGVFDGEEMKLLTFND